MYRGQPLASHRLCASLDRRLNNVSLRSRRDLQKRMRDYVVDRRPQLSSLSDDSVYALLQHHGAPTRLLDWSTRPYQAAFFAMSSSLEEQADEDDCAVWALDSGAACFRIGEGGVKLLYPSEQENTRAIVQRGVFTLNESLQPDIEGYLGQLESSGHEKPVVVLKKARIPRNDSELALWDLSAMGIDFESTYPDLSGLARASYSRALLGSRRELYS
ncbi:hypothetical protein BKD30_06715 [Tersicoccus phoenicis]|uniref:FRG domain-containing protein n=1 Tax=Tersicoccus phoenicis TaxID=554083 RepID=A0A1R1LCA3_9MICC|nr:hypothetical protein BKD30_06715 [Tersicoccus phoenicis]